MFLLCLFEFFHLLVVISVVIDSPESHTWEWKKVSRSDPSKEIELLFAVKQENVNILYRTLMEVSTPSHPKYGQHLTSKEVHSLVKPSVESSTAVIEWLMSSGLKSGDIKNGTQNGDILRVLTTVNVAEQLLSTKYFDYSHKYLSTVTRVDFDMDYDAC